MNQNQKKEPDLDENAWRNPETYREVFSRKDAQAIVLKHQGRIMACGTFWEIVTSKPMVGTITITLKKVEYK